MSSESRAKRPEKTVLVQPTQGKRKQVFKLALSSPLRCAWPRVNNEVNFVSSLVRHSKVLSEVAERAWQLREGKQALGNVIMRDRTVSKLLRPYLVFGINAVTKALEREQARAVVVAADVEPEHLVSHVLSQIAWRNGQLRTSGSAERVALCRLRELGSVGLGSLFGLRTCICFAVLKREAGEAESTGEAEAAARRFCAEVDEHLSAHCTPAYLGGPLYQPASMEQQVQNPARADKQPQSKRARKRHRIEAARDAEKQAKAAKLAAEKAERKRIAQEARRIEHERWLAERAAEEAAAAAAGGDTQPAPPAAALANAPNAPDKTDK